MSDGAVGLQAHIGRTGIDRLIERERATGDQCNIVVAAGEAAGGRDRAHGRDSADGETIDISELDHSGRISCNRIDIIARVGQCVGPVP